MHHPHLVACYGILKEAHSQKGLDGELVPTTTRGGSNLLIRNSIVTEACRTSLDHYLGQHSNWDGLTADLVDRRKYTILLHVSLKQGRVSSHE